MTSRTTPSTTAVTAGVTVGIVANMTWGLAFLVPVLLAAFDPVVITTGRYVCYGLVSVVIILATRTRLRHPAAVWRSAVLFAITGNVGYYFFVVQGVALVGAPVVAVIIGTLPVTVSVVGNLLHRDYPFRHLVPSLLLIGAGLVLVNLMEVDWSGETDRSLGDQVLGIGCALVALCLWTWYGVANSTFLKSRPEITSGQWSTMVGLVTLVVSLLVMPFLLTGSGIAAPGVSLWWLVAGSLVLGLLVSWGGTLLWNRASLLLPVSVAGQLIVFETLSGLVYVFVATSRMPPPLEVLGILLVLGGVLLALRRARRSAAGREQPV